MQDNESKTQPGAELTPPPAVEEAPLETNGESLGAPPPKKASFKTYLLLQGAMLLYSFAPVASKIASGNPVLSWAFILPFGVQVFILGCYALLWQQIIKRIPLSIAYTNKAVTVIWGFIWGLLIFNEAVTPQKVIGGVIILAGVALYSNADRFGKGAAKHG